MNTILDRKTFYKDDYIFREGDAAYAAYLIRAGKVHIMRFRDDEEVVLATLGKGQLFGELALIDSAPRSADAVAASNSVELVVVTEQSLRRKINELDDFMRAWFKMLTDRLRHMNELVDADKAVKPKGDRNAPPEDDA
ncbi:MAG: cyclic nucleotide-binding domain-containing protein [Pseudomonadota bacterium]